MSNTAITLWNKTLKTIIRIPGGKVNRTAYLKRELSVRCTEEQVRIAIESSPAKAGISPDVIDRIANSCIRWHTGGSTIASTIAGIPGGLWMAGTIPADFTQFYWQIVQIAQKLAYLYGWPDMTDEDNKFNDETLYQITIFIGVMAGVENASKGLTRLSEIVALQVAKKVEKAPLSKYAVYQIAKEVAKWLGIKMTKETAGRIVGKAIPVVSGIVSGITTCVSMRAMSYRLKKYLKELPLAG